MDTPSERLTFWFHWTLASAVGWLVGGILGFITLGATLGVAQWLILRRHQERAELWVLVKSLGVLLGIILAAPIQEWDLSTGSGMDLDILFYAPTFGAVVGAVEWLLVRSWFNRAYLWVLINVLAWGVGLFLGDAAAMLLDTVQPLIAWGLVAGGFAGAISGWGLLMLAEDPKEDHDQR